MIDGGPPAKKKAFLTQLSKFNINPTEIKLIILTHGDFDHIGSAKDFKEITGAKIAIHENDRPNLEKGHTHMPLGVTRWGKISRVIFKPFISAMSSVPLVKPDIVLNDDEFALNDFGIEGKIIFTPGHSPGSVSIILDNGDTFAGCMAQNGFPFTSKPNFPIYAFDINMLKKSWQILN